MIKADFFLKKDEYLSTARIMELMQKYHSDSSSIFLFFEADDDRVFYQEFISRNYQGFKIFPYIVNNKDNIYLSYSKVDWGRYNKNRVLFFADKDFDDLIERPRPIDENIFVTKYYSIENYCVSADTLSYVMRRSFKVEEDEILKAIISKFELIYEEFQSDIAFLIACILIFRKKSEHIDLDKIDLGSFYHISDFTLKKKKYYKSAVAANMRSRATNPSQQATISDQKRLHRLCDRTGADHSKVTWQEVLMYLRKLQNIPEKKVFLRGKQDVWFFIHIIRTNLKKEINKLIVDINKTRADGNKIHEKTNHLEINEKSIFDILASKINTPQDIQDFLTLNKNRLS